jgi:hypothetical protein
MAKEDAHEALTQQLVVRGGVVVQDPTSAKHVTPSRLTYIYIHMYIYVICIYTYIYICI